MSARSAHEDTKNTTSCTAVPAPSAAAIIARSAPPANQIDTSATVAASSTRNTMTAMSHQITAVIKIPPFCVQSHYTAGTAQSHLPLYVKFLKK